MAYKAYFSSIFQSDLLFKRHVYWPISKTSENESALKKEAGVVIVHLWYQERAIEKPSVVQYHKMMYKAHHMSINSRDIVPLADIAYLEYSSLIS